MLGVDLSNELSKSCELYGMDIVHSPWSVVHGFKKGNVTDKKSVAVIFKEVKPEIVIHAAAMTDVDGCELDKDKAYNINAVGTRNVASACAKVGATLIYLSTDFIFDGKKEAPYKENDKPNPINIYGDSKLMGEEEAIKNLKKYFIIRTCWLYGAHGENFVDTIIAKAKTENILKVVDDQVGSPTYTKDLAKAMRALLSKILGNGLRDTGYGIYHISNSGSISWYEYAKEILRFAGSKTEIIPITTEELDRPAKRPAMSVLDNSKFFKFTGYRMRNWKRALKEYIK